jgi:hypothetical protein
MLCQFHSNLGKDDSSSPRNQEVQKEKPITNHKKFISMPIQSEVLLEKEPLSNFLGALALASRFHIQLHVNPKIIGFLTIHYPF